MKLLLTIKHKPAKPITLPPAPRWLRGFVIAPRPPVVIHTDGSCCNGQIGIGATIQVDGDRYELSEKHGSGTNNQAEMLAVKRALESILARCAGRSVVVYTDSQYTINQLTQSSKPTDMARSVRAVMRRYASVELLWVKGHSGHLENERADWLASVSRKRYSPAPSLATPRHLVSESPRPRSIAVLPSHWR